MPYFAQQFIKCFGLQGKIRRKVLIFLMVMASLMVSTDCTVIINSIQDILTGLFVMFLISAFVTEALLNWKPVSTGNLVIFSCEVPHILVHKRVCKWQLAISNQASNPPKKKFLMMVRALVK